MTTRDNSPASSDPDPVGVRARAQARMFPIQGGPAIPWSVIAPFDNICQRNHGQQTLERLAERGGLCCSEAIDVLNGDKYDTCQLRGKAAIDALLARVAELQRLAAPWPGAWPPRLWACNFCRTVAGWPSESGMHGGGCKGDIVELSDWAVANHLRCHGNWPKAPLPPIAEREALSDFPKCSACGAAIWIEHAVDCPLVKQPPPAFKNPVGPGAWQPMEQALKRIRDLTAIVEVGSGLAAQHGNTLIEVHHRAVDALNDFHASLPPLPDHETGTP